MLGGFHHTFLVHQAKADVICGFSALSVDGKVVLRRWSPVANHGFYTVVYAVTILVGAVKGPVATIYNGVVILDRASVFLLPLNSFLVTIFIDTPETARRHRIFTVDLRIKRIAQSLKTGHINFLGKVLEREVIGVCYFKFVGVCTLFRGDEHDAESSL